MQEAGEQLAEFLRTGFRVETRAGGGIVGNVEVRTKVAGKRTRRAGMQRALTRFLGGLLLLACAAAYAETEDGKMWYCCKYCGHKAASVGSLTGSACMRHPAGLGKGRHALYEGSQKDVYVCKWCGHRAGDVASLTSSKCRRHPDGPGAGWHEPAL